MVAMEKGFYSFDTCSKELSPIVDPEADKPQNRFNDGAVDVKGRFWAGTLQIAEVDSNQGAMYCLESDLSVRKVFEK